MDIDDLGEVESVNTTIASVAASQLMKANPPCSTPKWTKPTDTSTIGTSTESPELVSKKSHVQFSLLLIQLQQQAQVLATLSTKLILPVLRTLAPKSHN